MAFRVWLDGDDPQQFGDDDAYDFLAGGVLVVHHAEPGTWSDYYPPAVWRRVNAAPNHSPGEPVDRTIGPDFD